MTIGACFSAVVETDKVVLSVLVVRPLQRTLSSREREVLHWLSLGKSAEDIALILDLSLSTIMFHCRRAARKYGTVNRTHTVAEAFRRGDLPLTENKETSGSGEVYEI